MTTSHTSSDGDDRIAAIRSRLDAASATPWTREGTRVVDHLGHLVADLYLPGRDPQPWHTSHAELIAHAPTDLAFLLAEVERLRSLAQDD